MKCGKIVGPTLRGFRVQYFLISNAQTPTPNNSRIAKSERKVGLALQGFGVRDFAISKAKHQHTTTLELRKLKGKWDQHFEVSGFWISRFQKTKNQFCYLISFYNHPLY
jgi:hypothetical protein